MIEATVVHIEDEELWRDQIKNDIERRGKLAFREFIGVPSIEEVRDRLRSMSGPVVIIMDLLLITPGEEKKKKHASKAMNFYCTN